MGLGVKTFGNLGLVLQSGIWDLGFPELGVWVWGLGSKSFCGF